MGQVEHEHVLTDLSDLLGELAQVLRGRGREWGLAVADPVRSRAHSQRTIQR